MRATRPPARPAASQRGFMLVAVLAFVLVLTLIGISLFAMGSFEASFLGDQEARAQSYFAARAGLIRGQMVLETTGDLGKVRSNLPPGVVRAVALRGSDSTGTLDWQGEIVNLVVTADVNGQMRRLRSLLKAEDLAELMKNLVANRDTMAVGQLVGLNGNIRQASNDLRWQSQVTGNHPVTIATVPALDIDAFVTDHAATAQTEQPPQPGTSGSVTYSFRESAGRFYVSRDTGDPSGYAFYDRHPQPTIYIEGTVVWISERGIRFRYPVQVVGDENARLVIVSRAGGTNGEYGIRLQRGLSQPTTHVPLVLASSGRILLGESSSYPSPAQDVRNIALYGDGIYLNRLNLTYADAGFDMDALVQSLYDGRLLPQAIPGVRGMLTAVPAGWADSTYASN